MHPVADQVPWGLVPEGVGHAVRDAGLEKAQGDRPASVRDQEGRDAGLVATAGAVTAACAALPRQACLEERLAVSQCRQQPIWQRWLVRFGEDCRARGR